MCVALTWDYHQMGKAEAGDEGVERQNVKGTSNQRCSSRRTSKKVGCTDRVRERRK